MMAFITVRRRHARKSIALHPKEILWTKSAVATAPVIRSVVPVLVLKAFPGLVARISHAPTAMASCTHSIQLMHATAAVHVMWKLAPALVLSHTTEILARSPSAQKTVWD
jgi:hypothetical protein